jgi:glycerol-3-phosphate acyltransferase PlsY
MLTDPLILVAAYLLGSIPFGLLIAIGMKGVDPRQSGSGNIGATNVLRTAGKKEGLLTLLGDLGKGYLAVLVASWFSSGGEAWGLAAGLACVLGHLYPIFLRFRGGKGVATGFGVLLGLDPTVGLLAFSLWALAFSISRISSVGALIAFGALPLVILIVRGVGLFLVSGSVMSGLIYLKHAENIRRLLSGAEERTEPKKS